MARRAAGALTALSSPLLPSLAGNHATPTPLFLPYLIEHVDGRPLDIPKPNWHFAIRDSEGTPLWIEETRRDTRHPDLYPPLILCEFHG